MNDARPRSPIVATLLERGFVKDCTDLSSLDQAAATGPLSAYVGFDLTAPSLHVGSLIQLMVLRHLKAHGHEAFVLFGDATTRIGDPSDKNGLRPVLSPTEIEANRVGIVRVIDQVIGHCRHVENSEWLDAFSLMDFLAGPARDTSLSRLLAMDVTARRLAANRPMALMELCYPLLQGMDFAELHRRFGVRLQIGGSDQWSNILQGVDMIRREGGDAFGLTTPLMTDEQGRKMGKTAEGQAVWLDAQRTDPFRLWQFWRNAPDAKVPEFLGLFTDLPMDEVRRLSALRGAEINEAKAALADEVVRIVHGSATAEDARQAAAALFGATGLTDPSTVPSTRFPRDPRAWRVTLADVLINANLAKTKAEARRLAAQGGVTIDGEKVLDGDRELGVDGLPGGPLLVAVGRRRRVLLQPPEGSAPTLPGEIRAHAVGDGGFVVQGLFPFGDGHEWDNLSGPHASMADAHADMRRVRVADPVWTRLASEEAKRLGLPEIRA